MGLGKVVVIAAVALALASSAVAQQAWDSVKLKWTAPGDDGTVGRATQYDLRYATFAITSANFATATRYTTITIPSVAGATDSCTVTGLTPSTTYWFAIKTADEVPNWATVSNIVTVTLPAAPDVSPPAAVTDFRVSP
jgi:hypothetical protein